MNLSLLKCEPLSTLKNRLGVALTRLAQPFPETEAGEGEKSPEY